jgi:opacity protein-like surface antigen
MSRFILAAAFSVLLASPAFAEEPKLISTTGDWSAYAFKENGGQVCYMASSPTKSEGAYKKRDKPFALITHRPAENTRNVFSYIAGYSYQPGSDVTVTIDKVNYTLFTHKDMAWAKDADTDNKLTQAIQKGSSMVVKGKSAKGTLTTDHFSLKGTGAAHDAIDKACKPK